MEASIQKIKDLLLEINFLIIQERRTKRSNYTKVMALIKTVDQSIDELDQFCDRYYCPIFYQQVYVPVKNYVGWF